MPDWKVALIAAAITTAGGIIIAIVTYFVAPIISARLRRGRDVADTRKADAEADEKKAQAEKVRAETRLLELGELEAKITSVVDKAVYGASDFIEQQRAEITELRNQLRDALTQISIMSETINTMVAQIRRLEFEVDQSNAREQSVHAANLKLLQRVDELEEQIQARNQEIAELLERIEELEQNAIDLPDGVIAP